MHSGILRLDERAIRSKVGKHEACITLRYTTSVATSPKLRTRTYDGDDYKNLFQYMFTLLIKSLITVF